MDQLALKLFHLDHCRGIGRKTIRAFLRLDPQLESVSHFTAGDLSELGMSRRRSELFLHDFHRFAADQMLHHYAERQIVPIAFHQPDYPPLLGKIYDPPLILYVRGHKEWLSDVKMISVVGTRRPSAAAGPAMRRILLPLVESGWIIVSGMATGIDGMAHRLAAAGGRTIAVLGSGLFHPYPAGHVGLFNRLCDDHLVISEYPPQTRPERWRFPERNRIISGLSRGTVVVEAKAKSGSLITADQALEQGREVFALPGSILNENSVGTNRLIQQGAKLILGSQDILDELAPFPRETG